MTDEEIQAAAEAEAQRQAEEAAAAEAAKTKTGNSDPKPEDKNKPSDAEAALLKDVMKQKKAAADAKAALDAANAKLREFDGLDPAELRKLLADRADAERKEAEKRGEYDRIITQVRDEAKKREDALAASNAETTKQLEAAQRRIDELTVGHSFANSKFLVDETNLSGEKARKLFGDHFEIEDGELVAYDKPAGSRDRTPLVDAQGNRLRFEAAIEKIIKADSDWERLAKSKLKTGSNSQQTGIDRGPNKSTAPKVQGRALIANVLKARTQGGTK